MNKFEQSSQSDPVSPEEVSNRESQAKSMMSDIETDASAKREEIMESLNFDQKTMDDFQSSYEFEAFDSSPNSKDLFRLRGEHNFQVNGHEIKISSSLDSEDYKKGVDKDLVSVYIDGSWIINRDQAARVFERYVPLIIALRGMTRLSNKAQKELKEAEEKRLIDEVIG